MLGLRLPLLLAAALLPLARMAASNNAAVGRTATDFSFETAEGLQQIRDFRPKWLLLQFGASWCRPSEYTATVFSGMQRALEGQPFVFVELSHDPTLTDVSLYSDVRFAGVRGIIPRSVPSPFDASSFPRWYLIDPHGTIRAAGSVESPDELRAEIKRALAGPLKLPNNGLDPAPEDKLIEDADYLNVRQNYPAARDAYFAIFQQNPQAVDQLLKAGMAEAFVKGDTRAGRLFFDKNLPAGAVLTDPQTVQMERLIKAETWKFEFVDKLGPVLERHPDSKYLASALLLKQKLPEDITDAELRAIDASFEALSPRESRAFLALAFESRGKTNQALQFCEQNSTSNQAVAHTIGLLTRHGQPTQARNIYFKGWPITRANAANAQQAWEYGFTYAMLSDWDAAAAYGARYQELIKDRPLGLEMQWLAAIRKKNFIAADALAKQVQAFAETHPKYAVAAAAFQGAPPPPSDTFLKGYSVHTRRDNLLPYALLAERQGNFETARETYRTMRELTDTVDFANALATHLTLTLGK